MIFYLPLKKTSKTVMEEIKLCDHKMSYLKKQERTSFYSGNDHRIFITKNSEEELM